MTNDKQRERLVELLKETRCEKSCDGFKNIEVCKGCTAYERYAESADHLLKNGVIVPPCKVGDTAYFLIEDTVAGEKYISPEQITDVCTKGFYTSGHEDSDENGDLWLWSDVGEIVFLDKTKAEEVLKGGKVNGK